jgi:hypothetical protein
MPRASEEKNRIEADRLRVLHEAQAKNRRRIQREIKVSKGRRNHLPGEEKHKKTIAVFMKFTTPAISYNSIAKQIGEPRATVRDWFKNDPEVKELYEFVSTSMRESTVEYMQTLSFEAVETLAILMRYGSEKSMYEAATTILDRIGIPKTSKQEIEAEHTQKHQWGDRDALADDIRKLSPDQQEEALKVIEELENLLSGQAEKTEVEAEAFEDEDDD